MYIYYTTRKNFVNNIRIVLKYYCASTWVWYNIIIQDNIMGVSRMNQQKAAQLLCARVAQGEGIEQDTLTVTCAKFEPCRYPSGLQGHYGYFEIKADGFKTAHFEFTCDASGDWRAYKSNGAKKAFHAYYSGRSNHGR